MVPHVQHALRMGVQYARMHLEDIPPEQWHEIPSGLAHNPAWIVGHVAASLEYVAQLVGVTPAHLPQWAEAFGMDSQAVAEADRYPPKDELLAALSEACDRYASLLESVSAEQLQQPSPEGMREFFPTLGDALVFMGTTHASVHFGQLSAWRTARGLPLHI